MHILIIFLSWTIFKSPSADSIHTAAVRGAVRLFLLFFFSSQIFGTILKSPVTDDTSPGGAEVTFAAGLRSCLSEEGRAEVTSPPPLSFPLSPQIPKGAKLTVAAPEAERPRPSVPYFCSGKMQPARPGLDVKW